MEGWQPSDGRWDTAIQSRCPWCLWIWDQSERIHLQARCKSLWTTGRLVGTSFLSSFRKLCEQCITMMSSMVLSGEHWSRISMIGCSTVILQRNIRLACFEHFDYQTDLLKMKAWSAANKRSGLDSNLLASRNWFFLVCCMGSTPVSSLTWLFARVCVCAREAQVRQVRTPDRRGPEAATCWSTSSWAVDVGWRAPKCTRAPELLQFGVQMCGKVGWHYLVLGGRQESQWKNRNGGWRTGLQTFPGILSQLRHFTFRLHYQGIVTMNPWCDCWWSLPSIDHSGWT